MSQMSRELKKADKPDVRPLRMPPGMKKALDKQREKELPGSSFNTWALRKLTVPMNFAATVEEPTPV